MESTGARLKEIRLQKGLTLEEVHKETKIPLYILKAIEEDRFIGLSPVYIKGFLKIYCKLLKLDPKDYIAGYQEPQIIPTQFSGIREKSISFLKIASLKLNYFRRLNLKIKTLFLIIFILFFSIGLFNLGKFISSKRKIQTTKLEKTQEQKRQTLVKEQGLKKAASPKKETQNIIRLGLRAKEDCWVHLKVDGRVVFHTVLKKGKFETWQAKDKIELSLGNAGVIELELNSKTMPTLGRKGQAIKNILITKEGGLIVPR